MAICPLALSFQSSIEDCITEKVTRLMLNKQMEKEQNILMITGSKKAQRESLHQDLPQKA